ncbi:hypothetical protein CANCADRAFT_15816, partial [Tortispora caseinolytica NRRL Y-17796]
IKPSLSSRHTQAIAFNCVLGVGLYITSSAYFFKAGPLGVLLGFIITGTVLFLFLLTIKEMTSFIPASGSLSTFGSRFVDDSIGFSMGILYWLSYNFLTMSQIIVASEMISAFTSIGTHATTKIFWISMFIIIITAVNFLPTRTFAECLFVAALIKCIIAIMLVIFLFVVNHSPNSPDTRYTYPLAFKFWDSNKGEPGLALSDATRYGPFRPYFIPSPVTSTERPITTISGDLGRFLQVLYAIIHTVFAYTGLDGFAIAATESRSIKRDFADTFPYFYPVLTCIYVFGALAFGLDTWAGDSRLVGIFDPATVFCPRVGTIDDNVVLHSPGEKSAFVISLRNAGYCKMSQLVIAYFIFSAVCAGAAQMYCANRTLYALAKQAKAPKIFARTKNGSAVYAIWMTALIVCCSYFGAIEPDSSSFNFTWVLTLSGNSMLIAWICTAVAYIRFYKGLKHHPYVLQRDSDNFPFHSPFQPYSAYVVTIFLSVLVLFSGFYVFFKSSWSTADFISSYVPLFIFIVSTIAYKLYRRTRHVKFKDMNFSIGRVTSD